MIRRIAAFALLLLSLAALPAQKLTPVRRALLPLDSGWEYRWGDSPLDGAGAPLWIHGEPGAGEWQPIDFPSNPPGREGRTNVWYRLRLPAGLVGGGPLRDPSLFIYSIDLNAELYLDGKPLYAFGPLDLEGRGRLVAEAAQVAEWGGDTADELLRRVDFLMYRAKEMGRNRVVSDPELQRAAEGEGA